MSAARTATLVSVRAHVGDLDVVEQVMFGTVALMVDGEMMLAVAKDGSLLVRVGRTEDATLLQEPDAGRAVMGPKARDMGAGWIRADVAADLRGDRIAFWVAAARRRRAAMGAAA